MEKLFKLRWQNRDRVLQKEFVRVRQEMNCRGVLNSSMTIQKAHEVIVAEFECNRIFISQTIIDYIKQSKRLGKAKDFEQVAQEQLSTRKKNLEQSLEGAYTNIIGGLNNQAMIAPFRTLESQYQSASSEIKIELNKAIDEYNNSFGNSLTAQLKTKFLNNPILAVVILSTVSATFIIGLLKLLGFISVE